MELTFSVTDGYTNGGKPVKEGLFSRNVNDELEIDELLERLEAGTIELEDALRVAIDIYHNSQKDLETCGFLGNLFWKASLLEEATEVYEEAYNRATKLIPKGFRGQISWLYLENRSFLRVAHGYLLGLMHAQENRKAKALANKLLRWCPQDNLGVRFLIPDINFINGEVEAALKAYLELAEGAPVNWYPAALCTLRAGNYIDACTYLRRGIAGNPYVAEGLTARVQIEEHLYWHGSNLHGPDFAYEYLDSPVNIWKPTEIDFVDWVFNSSDVLRERTEMTAIREALHYEHDVEARRMWGQRMDELLDRIDEKLSRKMVRKVTNRWGDEIWPWDREGFLVPTSVREERKTHPAH
jgi:tetratricopeptide (TPR) repeat protein